MIIAKQKRKTHIVEYLLYMWQIEDLIRAYQMDPDRIEKELINQYDVPSEQQQEIRDWYHEIIESMKNEQIVEAGHLQFLVLLADDLNDFHFRLVDSPLHSDYRKIYEQAVYNISDFRKKMGQKEKINDVEVCLSVLYGVMLMRMKQQTISAETLEAINSIRDLMAALSQKYRDFEEGHLEV